MRMDSFTLHLKAAVNKWICFIFRELITLYPCLWEGN